MPDRGAGESIDHSLAGASRVIFHVGLAGIDKFAAGFGGIDHLLSRTLTDPLGLAIAPDMRRQDRLVTLVDGVADCLAHEVGRNRVATELVVSEHLPNFRDVVGLIECGLDVKMVAPTGEFDAVKAHGFHLGQEFGDRNIGPLAGEESDGT